jgi:hypothetical protein
MDAERVGQDEDPVEVGRVPAVLDVVDGLAVESVGLCQVW